MSCKFSCFLSFIDSLKENDVGVFQSENGDQYRIKYRSNVCRDLLLTIEWRIPKQILVTVKLYNTTFKRCFSSRGLVVNGRKAFLKLRGAFNVSSVQNYKVLCVINLIPYIKFNTCNDIASQSFDSGFADPVFHLSSTDGHNNFYNETNCQGENVEEYKYVKNIINIERNEIVSSEFENSESVLETENNRQSEEKNYKLDKIPCNDGMNMEESNIIDSENIVLHTKETEISVTLIKKDNLISVDQNDKTEKNGKVYQAFDSETYRKISDNKKSSLKNSLEENKETALINKSDIKINEFSSDDVLSKIDDCTENGMQDLLLNADMLKEVFNKKLMTKKSTNAYDNLKLMDDKINKGERINKEKNLEMEVDYLNVSSGISSVPHYEENLSVEKVIKSNETFISSIKSSNFYAEIKNDIPVLMGNTNRLSMHNKPNSMTDPSNLEDNMRLESCDILEKNDRILQEDFINLTNYNASTSTGEQESLRINKDKQLSTSKSESPLNILQGTSDKIRETEINSRTVNCFESVSQKLSFSKTDCIFQTLVRKLSIDDSDVESNVNEEAEGNSGISIKSSESKLVKIKNLPIMESELKGLSMDMLDLFTTGDMADAVIINGDQNIKVHRAIVSARSSVLKQMFNEQNQETIKYSAVVDIPAYILEDVIIFLYVGLVYIKNTKMAQDLHEVAERYRISDLIDICSKYISK